MVQYFDSTEAMFSAIQLRCNQVLYAEVAPVVEAILRRHISSDIYSAYTPKPGGWVGGTTYNRTYALSNSVSVRGTAANEILVTSSASSSPSVITGGVIGGVGSFLQLLESGNMGLWHGGFPRPAVTNAQNEVNNNGQIVGIFQRAFN